ncbi:MAG: hypothetical protein WAL59_24655, partial [Roseiarcus sp.]
MKRQAVVVAIAILVQAPLATAPAEAIPFATSGTGLGQSEPLIQQVAVRVRAGGVHAGGVRVGGVHAGGARVGGVHGGGVRYGGVHGGAVGWRGGAVRVGGWSRPGNYYWRPGGAIAAGAAIGFVTAAAAASWAGAAPGPNMCWYYTDPSQTNGF